MAILLACQRGPGTVDTEELCYLSIAEAGRKLRARELSPVELTRAHLELLAKSV